MSNNQRQNMIRHRKIAAVALVAMLLAACSPGEPATQAQPTTTSTPEPELEQELEPVEEPKPEATVVPTESATAEEFSFAYHLHESLPSEWVAEFETIMDDIGELAPISPRVSEVSHFQSPMDIWAWVNTVENPFPEAPGVSGMCICGDGPESWMSLEMHPESFVPQRRGLSDEEKLDIHRYQVIVHEYFHVFQVAISGDRREPIWLFEGGAQALENLYSQQRYGESSFEHSLFPITATWVEDPSPLEGYEYTQADNNYGFSTFMTLALVKELQLQQEISEADAFRLVLVDFQEAKFDQDDWEKVFAETFGMRPDEFYATLNKYTITESPEEWYEGDVVDASPAMPSEDIRIEDIFSQTE